MVRRYVAVPEIPNTTFNWETVLFAAFKENIDLLIGTRGESDLASMAIARGDITVAPLGSQVMTNINTSHNTTPTALSEAAPLDSFIDLRNDVQQLSNDLFEARLALDLLIRDLTGA